MISQSSIERVLEAADIVRVVGEHVELKRTGANHKGLSPWSAEKTPSFVVSEAKGIYKDFSSGRGGNVISFVMEMEGVSFPEAVELLAQRYNVELEHYGKAETKERQDEVKRMDLCLSASVRHYRLQYAKEGNAGAQTAEARGWSAEQCDLWELGYAPEEWRFLTERIIENGYYAEAEQLGLVKHKDGKNYDVLRHRLVFPIRDENGRLIAFGARALGADQQPKYLNSPDHVLYKKERVLYGLNHAKPAIRKSRTAYITEGYADVISMHGAGLENTVATCGTALTELHAKLLKRMAEVAVLVYDGDDAGIKATERSIQTLVKAGLQVRLAIPEAGEDPDSLSRKVESLSDYLKDRETDALLWLAERGKNAAPNEKAEAVDRIAAILADMDSDVMREEYTGMISKEMKVQKRTLGKMVSERIEKRIESATLNNAAARYPDDIAKQIEEWRFFEKENQYWFQHGDGFAPVSNFIIEPLFHIYSKTDNKRLVRITNNRGKSAVLDISSKNFVSPQAFQEELFNEGNFLFEGNRNHFLRILGKLGESFPIANELKLLGWQREGFFAFANGIYNGKFQLINEYGVVEHEDKRYFLPSFSSVYSGNREDDDLYENDRFFRFSGDSGIGFETWAAQMVKVFGENGKLAVMHAVCCCFRDIIYELFKFFPHLYLFGQKGSGKSFLAWRLNNLFWNGQPGFNLTAGTNVGFFRKLGRSRNAIVWFDEYADNIDPRRIQALKAAYDGIGHEKGVMSRDNRTETTKVLSGTVISSQYLPTADDNALFTRSILLTFAPKREEDKFTNEEQQEAKKLMKWEKQGVSGVVADILKCRTEMEQRYTECHAEVVEKMKADLGGDDYYEERILQNYVTELATLKCLEKVMKWPMSYEEMYGKMRMMITEQSATIVESEGLSTFWHLVEYLFDSMKLEAGEDFKVETVNELTVTNRMGGKERKQWMKPKRLLYLKFTKLHGMYMEAHRHQHGSNGISRSSLQHYLTHSPAFIGRVDAHRFKTSNTSCYALDYDKLPVNLERLQALPEGDSSELPY